MALSYDLVIAKKIINKQNLDIVANNVANSTSPGYQADKLAISDDIDHSSFLDKLSYPVNGGVTRDLSQGGIKPTNNALDFAIIGKGYFAVEGNKFTRNGSLTISSEGNLITFTGESVLDSSQSPISIPANAKEVNVTSDGSISIDGNSTGQRIGVFTFEDERTFKKEGSSLYSTTSDPQISQEVNIVQGSVESSNVNSILSMAQLIEIQRNDEQLNEMLRLMHDANTQSVDETMIIPQ